MKTSTIAITASLLTASPAIAQDKLEAQSQRSATADIVVTAQSPEGYSVPDSGIATKTATPLIETPQSISIITDETLRDLKLPRVKDALDLVAGVRPNQSIGSGNSFIVRGFADGRRMYLDGLAMTASGTRSEFDTAIIDRIEVLKGPASVLYGRSEPGGIISITTKRPLREFALAAELQGGSFDTLRAIIDINAPLAADGKVRARVIGVYQDANTFRDLSKNNRRVIAPSLAVDLGPNTEWTVGVTQLWQDYIADFGIPVVGNRPINVPVNRSYGDTNDSVDTFRRTDFTSQLAHRFSYAVSLRHRLLVVANRSTDDFVNPAPAFDNAIQADGRTLDRNIFYQVSEEDLVSTNLDLIARFRHGAFEHQLLLGADYLRSYAEYSYFGDYQNPDPRLAIDLFNPRYGIDRALFAAARLVPGDPENFSVFRNEFFGVYLQDQLTIADRLHLVGAIRWDVATTGRGSATGFADADRALTSRTDRAWSPRFAALYELTPTVSAYASWSRSFGANNGVDIAGRALPPQRGEQYEIGLKAESSDKRFFASAALFTLDRSNLLTRDPASTTIPQASIAIGRARSRGLEIEARGEILPGLSLIGNYAYTDASVVLDNNGLRGNRLVNVPRHAGALSVRYSATANTPLPGLILGATLIAADERQGDAANSFQLPGYARFDALAGYRFTLGGHRVTAQINARNLFDRRYFESADPDANVSPRLGVYPGASREILASLRFDY